MWFIRLIGPINDTGNGMKHPLTEQEIRFLLKKDCSIRSLNVSKGTLVTPSALEFLKMNNITLNFTEGEEKNTVLPEAVSPSGMPVEYTGPNGEKLDTKPEEFTHLYGYQLTEKDNPVIVFRGKLDKLCAMILEAQVLGEERENRAYVNDLQEILTFVRSLLPAEYKGIPVEEFRVLGLSSKDLRERSHHPEKYFGRKHIFMHHSMGALCLRLNQVRTMVRETELAAVTAFRDPANPSSCLRKDIVKALNRLSSLFYILIYKYLPKNFSQTVSPGM
jgi:ethanolamine utilization cobalamin adenosyltransferase